MKVKTLLDYSLVAQAAERELKLLIRLQAPPGRARSRKPLNLGVVIDRSGSMGGAKIENTKRALHTLINHLGPEDCLSLVQFDENVEVLLEAAPVKDRDALRHLVDRIEVGGSTNLSAGWLQGLRLLARKACPDRVERGLLLSESPPMTPDASAARATPPDCINRCLLLTDGQANAGIQDSRKLALLGKSARQQWNIVTTTLGFGEGFNEDLLAGIARSSGGAFHFVDDAEHAPAVFQEELKGLLRLAAQNVEVQLRPEAAVKVVAQWTDYPATARGGGVAFALGDAYAGEEKNLLVSLLVPGLAALGPAVVARLETSFAGIGPAEVLAQSIRQEVRVHVAGWDAARAASPEVEVQQQYGLQLAAKARKRAIKEADGGDYKKAEHTLREAMGRLRSLPDPGGLLGGEVADMEEQARLLDESNYAHNRKVMSETACALSTGNYFQALASRARRRPPAGNQAAEEEARPAKK